MKKAQSKSATAGQKQPKVPWQDVPSLSLDHFMTLVSPVDEAMRALELKWGVGRLPRLVSSSTLASFKRGWALWCTLVATGDRDPVEAEALAAKILRALNIMDREATSSGAQPLRVDAWEAALDDGRVLRVVRTSAEASKLAAEPPPDQDGRSMVIWTMDELARVLPALGALHAIKAAWPGATIIDTPRPITAENDVADWLAGP